jgi:phosphate acetyltransferase
MIHNKLTIVLIPIAEIININGVTANVKNAINQSHPNLKTGILESPTRKQIESLLNNGELNQLLENFAATYEAASTKQDITIIPGIPWNTAQPYEVDINLAIAKILSAKIVLVGNSETTNIYNINFSLAHPYLKHEERQAIAQLIKNPRNTPINMQVIDFSQNFNYLDVKISPYLSIRNLQLPTERRMTPPLFRNYLMDTARKLQKRIVLPEGDEPRTIQAANLCAAQNLATCILLGDKKTIHDAAQNIGVTLNKKIEIIEPANIIEKYVAPLVELRKHKGMTKDEARKQLQDNVMLGTMMLQLSEVDGLVSGAVHTTANTIRPALQIIKMVPGANIVSSLFFMCLPEQVLAVGDCAINPNPTAEELADIAIRSNDSAKAFGIIPRVAMLSYSTGTSGAGIDVELVNKATQIVKAQRPDIMVEGPIQYDAAVDKEVGQLKAPKSLVAGKATVLIFPNLNAGNIAYKAVQRSMDIVCIGPMLQGLRKPVNDLSRGCLVEDIVFTIALTAIQAK